MKHYFNKEERENLKLMLCSNDSEQILLALGFIENSPGFPVFKYIYPGYQKGYKQTAEELCMICHYLISIGRSDPYAATILSWGL